MASSSEAGKKGGHRVAIVLIVAFVVIVAGVYYYYTYYINVLNVQFSISVSGDVPATIPSLGVTVQGSSSVVSSSCSTNTGGTAAYCQIKIPTGGEVSLQVQLTFSSPGCAYPEPTVNSGSLAVSQDYTMSTTFCSSLGTAMYFFVLSSSAAEFEFRPQLSPGNAVAGITFTTTHPT